jgi:hypothetical protein
MTKGRNEQNEESFSNRETAIKKKYKKERAARRDCERNNETKLRERNIETKLREKKASRDRASQEKKQDRVSRKGKYRDQASRNEAARPSNAK